MYVHTYSTYIHGAHMQHAACMHTYIRIHAFSMYVCMYVCMYRIVSNIGATKNYFQRWKALLIGAGTITQ